MRAKEFVAEISPESLERYLARADQQVSRRMDRMSQARQRLNKGYEIYHADWPAGSSQIVDRFEADTPALAQQYYERFIRDYVSDVDFDLRLRRSTGIMENKTLDPDLCGEELPVNLVAEIGNSPADYKPNRKRKNSLFHSTVEGHWVDVFFDRSEFNGTLHITFTVDGNYNAPSRPNSASKSTVKILSTVLNVVKQQLPEYIKKSRPPAISFTAKEDNRAGLYRKYFVPVIQNILGPKWQHEEYPTMGMTVFHWKPVKQVKEVTLVPTVAKSKREHLDVMPNEGRPIPRGEESDYLGDLVAEMGDGFQLWSWTSHGTVTYYVFDTESQRCQLGTTGRPYKTNRDSFVIHGVYSGPKNHYRAADLYAFLILSRGLTLVSDYKQSEGGYRVWQELERRYGKEINIHGFDTKTNKPVNVTTQDEPDTHVDRATIKKAGPKMKKELGSISRDLRFVASAR
jgi:hypothetical protein